MTTLGAVRRLLVIAPHPDDEAIAAWALMQRLRRCGAHVAVLVVSDGGASHPNSRRWPPDRLIPERRREVHRVLRPLGVTQPSVHFLSLPDGGLSVHAAPLRRALARFVRRQQAHVILSPVPDDAHADHRAVAAALARVPRGGERRLGYGVWPEGAARTLRHAAVALTPAQVIQKRAALRRYRTQAGLIADADAGFAMTHRHLRAFARPTERFAKL